MDLYQIHRGDHATRLEETLEALHDLVKAGKVRYLGASSMPAWEFAKALHSQREHGWARFRGRLARPWEAARSTARAETDGGYADLLYTAANADSDHAVIDAVGAVASAHGVSRAQVALAWLHAQPAVAAPLVGASSTRQVDEAVASLSLRLTPQEVQALEAPYTPR